MINFMPLYAFFFLVLLTACSKEKGDESSRSPYYFTATINGKSIKYEADDESSRYSNGTASPYMSLGYDEFDIYEGTTFIDDQDLTHKNITVLILKHFNDEPTVAQRAAMFHTGNYGYGKSDVSDATVNGASILYTDDQGVEWSSEGGSQAGSSFAITELSENESGNSQKIFKARFNCKLYDENGNSILVADAEVRGQILPF